MCDPFSIAMVATAAYSAYKGVQGAKQRRSDAHSDAEAMELDALDEEAAANERAAIIRKDSRKVRGNAQAAYGAAGVEVSSGSVAAVDRQIATDAESDAWNAILEGKQQANRIRRGAANMTRAADHGVSQSYYTAAGSLLSAAGQAYRGGWGSQPKPQQAAAPIEDRSIQINT